MVLDKMIFELVNRAFALPKWGSFVEFLDEGFQLNREDRLGKFQLELTPWLRTVAEWLDDLETEWVYLIQGSQTGKTTLQMAYLLYIAQRGPTRVLWVQSTEEEAKQFVTERLRPYIEGYDAAAIAKKSWRTESFRVFDARVKVAFSTNEQTLRSIPAQYIIGDECAVWKHPISLVKKRTRTFAGRRKGIFGTTPPRDEDHFSWKEACAANFYRWYVPCPHCQEYQPLILQRFKWYEKDGTFWDYDRVRSSVYYECRRCHAPIKEGKKLAMIGQGRPVCVDPYNDFIECAPRPNTAKTLQVPAFYSMFSSWGEEAVLFLQAKAAGMDALKIYITDELAESPKDLSSGESLKENELFRYVAELRPSGFLSGYDLYTAGVDVQRNGELFVVLVGWERGVIPTGHVLIQRVCAWNAGGFEKKWGDLLAFFSPFLSSVSRVAIDATDGMVTQDVYDFVNYSGAPYIALKDSTTLLHLKTQIKMISPEVSGKKRHSSQVVLVANSDRIKDDLAAAFQREPGDIGAWSFPSDVTPDFLKALTLEHRTMDRSGRSSWKPKYAHAPQHYFSALVYACAAMEEFRGYLCSESVEQPGQRRRRFAGVDIWQ